MTTILVIALIIAIIIIYDLNEKNNDRKTLTSTYRWKLEVIKLHKLIDFSNTKKEEYLKVGDINKANEEDKRIKTYLEKTTKLEGFIYVNENYLRKKGRI